MKRLLFSLYGFAFFNKFLLLTPVYAIFMQQNGLTDFQLSMMFIVSAIGTILAQAPIAMITNRVGQRWSMMTGQFLKMFAILLWLVMPNYIGFVVGMFLWGVQAGFRSVAFEGLVYDSVSVYGMSADYPKILGRKSTYESIGTALSAFGSLLMFMGYEWVTWTTVMAILVSMICLLMVPRAAVVMNAPVSTLKFRKLLRTGIRVCLRTPCLMTTMVLALLAANIPYLDDFLSPIGLQVGIPTEYIGIVLLFLLGCATLGQRFAYKFTHVPDWIIYALIGVVGINYILFGLTYSAATLWLMGIGYTLFYGIYTMLYSRFQHMTPSSHRSVVLSLYTTINYLIYMAVCGIVGLGATLGSWRFSIMILGGLMLVLCMFGAIFIRGRCRISGDI